MDKFTKGKWYLNGVGDIVVGQGIGQMRVAHIIEHRDEYADEDAANAKLIVAAPKLLGECIKAKTVIGQLRPSECLCSKTQANFCNRCAADLAIEALDAVIADAT